MAKITLVDGTVFEGTPAEIVEMSRLQAEGKAVGPLEIEEVPTEITHNDVEYTLVDRKAEEGDIVLVTHENGHCFKPNKLYGPCYVDSYGLRVDADSSTGRDSHEVSSVYNDYYGRTLETVTVYARKEASLAVGDYAKVIDGEGNFPLGTIAKLIKIDSHDNVVPYKLEAINGEADWAMTKRVVKATDEEVATAKAQAESNARDAIFTKNGRKPNEYRKGDILAYHSEYSRGTYEVSKTVGSRVYFYDDTYECNEEWMEKDSECIRIVTFAESRLDTK